MLHGDSPIIPQKLPLRTTSNGKLHSLHTYFSPPKKNATTASAKSLPHPHISPARCSKADSLPSARLRSEGRTPPLRRRTRSRYVICFGGNSRFVRPLKEESCFEAFKIDYDLIYANRKWTATLSCLKKWNPAPSKGYHALHPNKLPTNLRGFWA